MINYYKRQWSEVRGGEYDDWGVSDWYFEVDKEGEVFRQIQVYENGNRLKYSEEKLDDDFGGLADQKIELSEFESFRISKEEFEKEWLKPNFNI
jgi:hypothetical protein